VSVYRWVQRFTALLTEAAGAHSRPAAPGRRLGPDPSWTRSDSCRSNSLALRDGTSDDRCRTTARRTAPSDMVLYLVRRIKSAVRHVDRTPIRSRAG
jgi:hypothetical protein